MVFRNQRLGVRCIYFCWSVNAPTFSLWTVLGNICIHIFTLILYFHICRWLLKTLSLHWYSNSSPIPWSSFQCSPFPYGTCMYSEKPSSLYWYDLPCVKSPTSISHYCCPLNGNFLNFCSGSSYAPGWWPLSLPPPSQPPNPFWAPTPQYYALVWATTVLSPPHQLLPH